MSFLAGDGEMATRIRGFDWASHPFGRIQDWPQSLRSALGICLQSAFPTAIYWGSDLRLLYNDAWAPIPGPRHPAALGAPAREVWSDIWHIIEPQFAHLIETGEGLFVEEQLLPMRRFGVEEQTYWTYSFTPIRGSDGAIFGVFNSGSETTQNVVRRRQAAFLLELSDALRGCADPRQARDIALEMLGVHLGAARTGIREREQRAGNAEITVVAEWTAPAVAPLGPEIGLADLGDTVLRRLTEGHVVRLDGSEANQDAGARGLLAGLGVDSALAVPWMEKGRLTAILYVHSRSPRHWTDLDVATVEQVLERTMGWIERDRALARERVMAYEIDHRARNLLAVVTSIVRLTKAADIDDFRHKLVDRFSALSGTHSLLAERRWDGVTLEELLVQELAPLAGGRRRTDLEGPHLVLPPETAQSMAMVLHELVTNAAKYGALQDRDGRLEVVWQLGPEGDLRIVWQERLSQPARLPAPGEAGGFGTTLLMRIVEDQFGGRILREFAPEGLRCEIVVPLESDRLPQEGASPAASATSAGARSILIVEDEAVVACDLADMVRDLGYDVFDVAPTLEHGLAALEQGTPSLTLLDANLAGVSSEPLADMLARREVPILVTSGYSIEPDDPGGLARYPRLEKPFSASLLRVKLSELLGSAGPA